MHTTITSKYPDPDALENANDTPHRGETSEHYCLSNRILCLPMKNEENSPSEIGKEVHKLGQRDD